MLTMWIRPTYAASVLRDARTNAGRLPNVASSPGDFQHKSGRLGRQAKILGAPRHQNSRFFFHCRYRPNDAWCYILLNLLYFFFTFNLFILLCALVITAVINLSIIHICLLYIQLYIQLYIHEV